MRFLPMPAKNLQTAMQYYFASGWNISGDGAVWADKNVIANVYATEDA